MEETIMGEPTPRQKVQELFRLNRRFAPLLASPLATPTIEQMEKSGVFYPAGHQNAEKMVRLAEMAYQEIGIESVRIPFDLCIEGEAFGCEIHLGTEIQVPSVRGECLDDYRSFRVPDDIFERGRFHAVFDAIRILDRKYPELPIFVQFTGPFTLAGHLMGVENFLMGTVTAPDDSLWLMARVSDFLIQYIRRIHDCGDVIVTTADPTASGDLVSAGQFQNFILPFYQKITGSFDRPMGLHICGNTNSILDLLPESGFRAFAFEGPAVAVSDVKEVCGDRIVRVGNVPTFTTLMNGQPEDVEQISYQALVDGVDILAPACGVPVQTTNANLRAMKNAVERFWSKKN
jgi:[methyl-Co(III) methanol-specific corrinoid protein]:coenzyme M methyltransferase